MECRTGEDNIQVVCRVRPLNERESSLSTSQVISVLPDAQTVSAGNTKFLYDHALGVESTQERVFQLIGRPLCNACLHGYNGTIFAYGQTGSGKTFTVLGSNVDSLPVSPNETNGDPDMRTDDSCDTVITSSSADSACSVSSSVDTQSSDFRGAGLIPRSLQYLFAQIEREHQKADSKTSKRFEYSCTCSFLEIYNEKVYDLLELSKQSLPLREDTNHGVYVEGLTHAKVVSAADAQRVMMQGSSNRHVGATAMNRESSRSHSVFTLNFEAKEYLPAGLTKTKHAKFNLVDLAGSERQKSTKATGIRLKEAANINKSLSALGNVIYSLASKSKGKSRHVAYRDSKLTFLLKDSLGGNSRTFVVATVSPAEDSLCETLSTLKFAARAKLVRNDARINEDTAGSVMLLQAEVNKLRAMLQAQKQHQLSAEPNLTQADWSQHIRALENAVSQQMDDDVSNDQELFISLQNILTESSIPETDIELILERYRAIQNQDQHWMRRIPKPEVTEPMRTLLPGVSEWLSTMRRWKQESSVNLQALSRIIQSVITNSILINDVQGTTGSCAIDAWKEVITNFLKLLTLTKCYDDDPEPEKDENMTQYAKWLQGMLGKRETELLKLRAIHKQAQRDIVQHQAEHEHQTQELAELNTKLSDLQRRSKSDNFALANLESDIQDAEDLNAQLSKKCQKLENENRELQRAHATQNADMEAKIKTMELSVQAERTQHEQAMEKNTQLHDELKLDNQHLRTLLQQSQSQIDKLKLNVQDAQQKSGELQRLLVASQASEKEFSCMLSELQRNLTEMRVEFRENPTQLDEYQTDHDTRQHNDNNLMETHTPLKNKVDEQNVTCFQSQEIITDLKHTMQSYKQTIENLLKANKTVSQNSATREADLENMLRSYTKELAKTKEVLAEKEEYYVSTQNSLHDRNAEFKEATKAINSLQNRLDLIEVEKKKLSTELLQTQEELTRKCNEFTASNSSIQALQQQLETSNDAHNALKIELSRYQSKINTHMEQLAEINMTIQKMHVNTEISCGESKTLQDTHEPEQVLEATKNLVEQLHLRLQTIRDEKHNLTDQIEEREGKLKARDIECHASTETIDKLQKQLNAFSENENLLMQELNNLKQSVQNKENDLHQANELIRDLQQGTDSLKSQNQRLSTECAEKREAVCTQEESLSKMNTKVSNFESKLNECENELQSTTLRAAAYKSTLDETLTALKQTNKDNDSLKVKITSLTNSKNNLTQLLASTTSRLDGTLASHTRTQENLTLRVGELETQQKDTLKQLTDSQEQCKTLRQEVDLKSSALMDLEATLQTTSEQLKRSIAQSEEFEEKYSNARKEIQLLMKDKNLRDQKVQDLEITLNEMETKSEKYERQIADANSELECAHSQLKIHTERLGCYQLRIEQLNMLQEDTRLNIQLMREQNIACNDELKTLNTINTDLSDRLASYDAISALMNVSDNSPMPSRCAITQAKIEHPAAQSLLQELQNREKKLLKAQDTIEKMSNAINQLEQAQAQHEVIAAESTKMQKELHDFELHVSTLLQENGAAERQIEDLQAENKQLAESLQQQSRATDELEANDKRYDSLIEHLEESVMTKSNQLRESQEQYTVLKEKLKRVETETQTAIKTAVQSNQLQIVKSIETDVSHILSVYSSAFGEFDELLRAYQKQYEQVVEFSNASQRIRALMQLKRENKDLKKELLQIQTTNGSEGQHFEKDPSNHCRQCDIPAPLDHSADYPTEVCISTEQEQTKIAFNVSSSVINIIRSIQSRMHDEECVCRSTTALLECLQSQRKSKNATPIQQPNIQPVTPNLDENSVPLVSQQINQNKSTKRSADQDLQYQTKRARLPLQPRSPAHQRSKDTVQDEYIL